MRNRRILPAMVASTKWPFGKCTRNVLLGSTSSTMPSISIASSFAIEGGPLVKEGGTGAGAESRRTSVRGGLVGGTGEVTDVDRGSYAPASTSRTLPAPAA